MQLDKQERDALRRLLETLAKAREELGTIELQQLEALLFIAVEGKVNQQDVGSYLKLTKAAASRNVTKLSDVLPGGKKPGPGFVDAYDDPHNRRYKLVRITPQGLGFVATLADILQREPKKQH